MLSEREVSASIGGTAYSTSGDKIGTVEHFFVDDRTGAPSWVAVSTGLFGTRHSIVPATEATFADGGLRLPVTADAVKSAPHLAGDHLSPEEETQLRRHYGLQTDPASSPQPGPQSGLGAASGSPAWTPTRDGLVPPGAGSSDEADAPTTTVPAASGSPVPPPPPSYGMAGEQAPGPRSDAAENATAAPTDGAMTRSEERLQVGTERVAAKRVRLVKYVVTEEVQITVPIRREEIRVEEVPMDGVDEGVPAGGGESLVPVDDDYGAHSAGRSASGSGTGGLPDEIVLHTERPVVTVEVVPTERVRLRTELVHGQETVTEQVQRERIAVDETSVPGVNPR